MYYSQLSEETLSAEAELPARIVCVSVANETDGAVDVGRIDAAVQAVFSKSPYNSVTISVGVVDDPTIHELNRRYLGHDYPTDVLSFTLEDDSPRLEGEIIVSIDTAKRLAVEAGWSAADELMLYVVHGALHLAGYRDKCSDDAAEMRLAEREALRQLGIIPSARDSRWGGKGPGQEDNPL